MQEMYIAADTELRHVQRLRQTAEDDLVTLRAQIETANAAVSASRAHGRARKLARTHGVCSTEYLLSQWRVPPLCAKANGSQRAALEPPI
jgi:hypothetical protein